MEQLHHYPPRTRVSLASPEADDVGEELGLLGCPVSVGSVDLVVDLACINETAPGQPPRCASCPGQGTRA